MFRSIKLFVLVAIVSLVLLSACSLPNASAVPTQGSQNLIYTAAAETVIAQITQAASGATQPAPTQPAPTQPGETPQAPAATSTQTEVPPQPSNTAVPPTAVPPTAVPPTSTHVPAIATPIPATATPVPCNQMQFVKDVNYPDDTALDPGTTFDKTWRLKNTGSCTWNSDYVLIFDHGDALGSPASVLLTDGKVHPGETIDATVSDLVAPNSAGTYQGFWKVRDGSGHIFGYGSTNKAFWVKIEVTNPVNYDFIAKAKKASWNNASDSITFGAAFSDAGYAALADNQKMENGTTYSTALATYPERIDDGIVTGLYTDYTVQKGDHFRSMVGFRISCQVGQVKFQLSYDEGGTVTLIKQWSKKCNGSLLTLDYDLSALKGHTVKFILGVTADGSSLHDNVLWINPRIQK
jgi:hypothetical protein